MNGVLTKPVDVEKLYNELVKWGPKKAPRQGA
jgi:hypothetical protein